MEAHVRLIGIDVALPVDDHLGAAAVICNGVDTSGKRLWLPLSIERRVRRSATREQPCPQRGDLGQLKGAPGGDGDLVGIRKHTDIAGSRTSSISSSRTRLAKAPPPRRVRRSTLLPSACAGEAPARVPHRPARRLPAHRPARTQSPRSPRCDRDHDRSAGPR